MKFCMVIELLLCQQEENVFVIQLVGEIPVLLLEPRQFKDTRKEEKS